MSTERRAPGARKPARNGDKNQGEGNRDAAQQYNEAQRAFVSSERGREAIRHAGDLDDDARRAAEAAERKGRAHAKDEDPAVTRRHGPGEG
ncbi:MAG: hypothetical protein HY749_24780 [Gammaproteobacteria bacterium]|nr:hypothetical protein [Gammaproteobacteria bacterium]MBI5619189.1 hypothetical protein [Gammaproteobacteria bacterium]